MDMDHVIGSEESILVKLNEVILQDFISYSRFRFDVLDLYRWFFFLSP